MGGWATLDAVVAAGNPHYPGLLDVHQVQGVYLFGAEEPDTWVDIQPLLSKSWRLSPAIATRWKKRPAWAEDIRRCNLDYGRQRSSAR